MRSKKTTIKDVAREAGTSPSTVSRVLTGNAKVCEEKRSAILSAIKRLEYRPSLIARGLKTHRTSTIGMIINDITNPFYSMVIKGAENEAKRSQYSLILCDSNEDAETELNDLHMLHDKQVDGIIFGPTGQNIEPISDLARRIPIVQIDRHIPSLTADAVIVDNEIGAYRAVALLAERGHKRIGLVGWQQGISSEEQRIAGYCRAIQAAGMIVDARLMSTCASFNPGHMAGMVDSLLENQPRPTAIFAINNQFGIVAMQAIRRAQLRIPEDVALVVFDDLVVFTLTSPPISVVAQPAFDVGQRAVQQLKSRINGDDQSDPQLIVLPTELIVRESV